MISRDLVDLVGIEPTTSSMPWKRAPSCATGPLRKSGGKNRLQPFYCPAALSDSQTWTAADFVKSREFQYPDRSAFLTMNLKTLLSSLVFFLCLTTLLPAQTQGAPAAVPYTSVSELNAILGPLQSAAQATQADLSKLRIERWKMDSGYKKQALANVDSLKRNLQGALPEIITQVQSAPEDMSATFKLYRNLDALYDVLGSVAETAGAFGSKDEYQSLSNDLNALERARHDLGERMQNLTASKEAELSQLRNQVRTLQATAPPPAPKKIVVDDNEPAKPVKKKVPRPPKPTTPAAQATPAPVPAPQKPPQ